MESNASPTRGHVISMWKGFRSVTQPTSSAARLRPTGRRIARVCRDYGHSSTTGSRRIAVADAIRRDATRVNMIMSAAEFIRLRTSTVKAEYDRAAHESAPLEVWWELVREHPAMRAWVVHNKTVPLQILEALAGDASAEIRADVARKRKLSPALFEQLARDPDSSVRHAVAFNAKTPPALLELLADDASDAVAETARGRRIR